MKRVVLFLLIAMPAAIYGQYYDAGNEPASVKWYTIDAEKYRLIFPEEFTQQAQQLAGFLDSLDLYIDSADQFSWKKIPILFHSGKTVSNGFVGWAPSRMEIFTVPPMDNYAERWLEQLGIHEGTHVYQFSRSHQGMTKVLGAMFGQHIPAALMGIYLPFWFIEGEAVYNETRYSKTGRGRMPEFEAATRSRIAGGMHWSYDKAYLGSYREDVPDHYALGYQLYAWGANRYGTEMWDSVTNYVARNPWNPMAFARGLKKYTGLNKTKFYNAAVEYFDSAWALVEMDTLTQKFYVEHPEAFKDWRWYRYPKPVNDSLLLAEVTTKDDTRKIVLIDWKNRKKEKTICRTGYHFDEGFDYHKGLICYSEYIPHPRFEAVEYGDVFICDIGTKRRFRISFHDRLFSPVFVHTDLEEVRIAAIRYHESHRHSVVVFDGHGNELKEWELPNGSFASNLSWWASAQRVLFIETGAEGKRIATLDPENGTIRGVTPWSYANVSHPVAVGDTIWFSGGFGEVANIYAFANSSLYAVTNSHFGAFYPAPATNGSIFFSEQLTKGVDIALIPARNTELRKVRFSDEAGNLVTSSQFPVYREKIDLSSLCDTCYSVERYRRFKNLFRFHSWAPAAIFPDQAEAKLGVSLFSHNTLSTSILSAGYTYDPGTRDHKLFADYTYKGFWPQIDFRYEFAKPWFEDPEIPEVGTFRWNEHFASLRLSVPLDYSKGNYFNFFRPSMSLAYLSRLPDATTHERFITGDLTYLSLGLYGHHLRKRADRNIYPKWGQVMELHALNTLGGTFNAGKAWSAVLVTYWPGLLKNHGFRIYAGYQEKQGRDFGFNQLITSPRGYTSGLLYNGFVVRANYQFPLLCPDLAIGPLAYIKRIRVKLFRDYMEGDGKENKILYRSYGLETIADMHLLRHFAPIEMGVGYAKRDDGENHFWLVFNIDFVI
jgi:hypothetical protein